jgi:hypothetical protein
MTNKPTIAAGIGLLLAGLIAAIYINRTPAPEPTGSGAGNPPAAASRNRPAAGDATTPATAATRSRPRDETDHQDLVAKFGESRTNLAKHVSTNVIGLLEDAAALGEMAISGATGGPFGSRAGLRMGLGRLGNDLKLSEEQQAKATAAYAAFQQREVERSKANLARLKDNPSSLMQLMLASDASSRGNLTDDEYTQLQTRAAQDLQGVLNPLDERNFRGGKPLNDATFLNEFKAVLDPTQAATLEASLAEQAAQPAPNPNEGNISNLPKMELEKLDQAVTSAKKITTGLKSMMEGMGGMRDLGPLLEQPRQGDPPKAP